MSQVGDDLIVGDVGSRSAVDPPLYKHPGMYRVHLKVSNWNGRTFTLKVGNYSDDLQSGDGGSFDESSSSTIILLYGGCYVQLVSDGDYENAECTIANASERQV